MEVIDPTQLTDRELSILVGNLYIQHEHAKQRRDEHKAKTLWADYMACVEEQMERKKRKAA